MKNKVFFLWDGVPPKSTFQQRNKNFHLTANARLAMAQWQAILEQHIPAEPLKGPIRLQVYITWPHTTESRKKYGGLPVYKTTRPDGDNILKGIKDICTKLGYWKDDSEVALETVARFHGDISGVSFEAEEVE